MSDKNLNQTEDIGIFQIVVFVLTMVVLGMLLVEMVVKLPEEISKILDWTDTCVCLLLLIDFAIRFRHAKSKLQFMKWGWIDLVASIPTLPMFRAGRLIRLLRIIRLLRAIRVSQRITSILFRNKIHGGLTSVVVIFALLVIFSSVGVLICEQPNPDAKIKSAEDAIWWSVATITTVGYGDLYPITTEGRCLAMLLMISGVGMFGALSGIIASFMLGQGKEKGDDKKEIMEMLKQLDAKIEALQRDKKIHLIGLVF